MPQQPRISVLMACYNDRAYLAEAVESILAQTLLDFELIIVDDGSTDESAGYLHALTDPRIRILRNHRNLGLPQSLNRGLALCTGAYIARMDADDIAEPDRLQLQQRFLDAHPDVAIVGSSRTVIDDRGAVLYHAPAVCDDLAIRLKCLLGNPFAHPTVMLRADTLARHNLRYDPAYPTAQDYELWVRLLAVSAGANIDRPLVRYRIRPGISTTRKPEQLANHDRIALRAVRTFVPGFPIAPDEIPQLRGRYGGVSVRDPALDPADPHWLSRYADLLESFLAHHHATDSPFASQSRTNLHQLRPQRATAP